MASPISSTDRSSRSRRSMGDVRTRRFRLSSLWVLPLIAALVVPIGSSATPPVVPNEDTGGPGGGSSAVYLTVQRLFTDVFTGQDGEACTELMTADAHHQTPTGQYTGPDGFNAFVATIWAAFPDAVFLMEDVSEAGDQVTVRWSMTGTHLGLLDDQAASGNQVALHGLALFSFDQERIAASWIEYDRQGLYAQIAAPAMVPVTCPECRELPY
jgi:predicted ester cyclase